MRANAHTFYAPFKRRKPLQVSLALGIAGSVGERESVNHCDSRRRMGKADARRMLHRQEGKVGGSSAHTQAMIGGRIPGNGMRTLRSGGELSSEDQGMKAAGRIWEMLKGPEYTLKKRVFTGLTISKSMHFQPRALPDQGIGTNLCMCKAGARREASRALQGVMSWWGRRIPEALRGLEP